MRLLSVNVSQPRRVEFGSQSVETGIFKKPVAGSVAVGTLNLEGDRQADLKVHGGQHKAVYAYSWENIEYWRQYLHRDDLAPGSFGENVTVDELTDEEVAIGDELEIGTARFVVTQPRIPCFKLGIALGDPQFPRIFHRSGRNGFYLQVLQEGAVGAGDSIRLRSGAGGDRVTIAEFVRTVNSSALAGKQLERVLGLQTLPQSWKDHLSSKFRARNR